MSDDTISNEHPDRPEPPEPEKLTPPVDDSPVDDSPVDEVVALEEDADGQVVPGYERCGVHPRIGQAMRKVRS